MHHIVRHIVYHIVYALIFQIRTHIEDVKRCPINKSRAGYAASILIPAGRRKAGMYLQLNPFLLAPRKKSRLYNCSLLLLLLLSKKKKQSKKPFSHQNLQFRPLTARGGWVNGGSRARARTGRSRLCPGRRKLILFLRRSFWRR